MTERKFTDEEVIKALECCGNQMYSCTDKQCKAKTLGDALDLINRQKAEIEGLESEIDKQYEQAKADILGNMADGGTSCHWCIEQHKINAIKEFAEEFEKRCLERGIYPVVIKNILKNLVKEKTESNNK